MKIIRSLIGPSLLALAIAGCGHNQPPNTAQNPPPEPTTSPAPAPSMPPGIVGNTTPPSATTSAPEPGTPPTSTADNTPPSGATSMQDGAANGQTVSPLTDDQILGVIRSADQGEIEQARLAESRTKDHRVRKFAEMMIHDHTDADAKAEKIARSDNLSFAPSQTQTSLETDAHGATSSLQSQTGTDFDRQYADTQVKEHQSVLDLIDQKLLPAASDPKVKDYLTAVRGKVAMHLQQARELQSKLQQR